MPDWLVILLLFELVVICTNPNERDYSWFQGLRRPAWHTFHIWSPLIRLAFAALGLVPYLIWTFVDHLAQWQMIGLNSVGNDHRSNRPSNRSVSSYRSFAQEVKRLKQSLTRSRRPR